jgi:16S rRNA (guanine527-N7)-methyltransferase
MPTARRPIKMLSLLKSEFPQFEDFYPELDQLARLVEEKSKVINITAIRDYEKIWEKHILDSLMCSKIELVEEKLAKAKVLDLGTGGGFPGLPLAITHTQSSFVLLDSTRKKLDVVREFVFRLKLQNVDLKWGRSTELIKELGGSFDIIVARGVAFLPELISLCQPFMKKDGMLVLYKQIDNAEIEAGDIEAKNLGLKLKEKYEYAIDGSIRVILVYTKA